MRLLICAGGTGGGVYPALAVLKALQEGEGSRWHSKPEKPPSPEEAGKLDVLWIGGEGGIEVDLLTREKIDFSTIPAAGVHGVGLRVLPGNLWQIYKGFISARRIIKDYRPQVMFFTGGYLAVPVALAGRSFISKNLRPRILVYVPDIEPGLALRLVTRLSDQIALTVEESMNYFANRTNTNVTGYPVRSDLWKMSKSDARKQLNLSKELLTLLVFGGSKGARSINRALIPILPDLLAGIQVIHISGHLDWPEIERVKEKLSVELQARYRAFPYLYQEMGAALSAADLVVSRAGASVLGEFPLFELPAILIPYPHAWRYQEVNARYLEANGAAVVLQDGELELNLLSTIREVMNDQGRRERMSQSMLSLATPKAAESIADLLHRLVSVPGLGRI
jgi:UDP-N-acetylglucosamine--N-acetylmuramyl-(pentapeptide) pyrophosphoryl-undecaprenol N-acetylglucosamine transferase